MAGVPIVLSFAAAVLLPAVDAAAQAQCPNPSHDCCTIGTGGCSDIVCCQIVCGFDPFCCASAWDSLCVENALAMCKSPCEPGSDCCYGHESAGCDDAECTDIVCGIDRSCCDVEWDNLCAISATEHCPVCGGEPPFDPCPAAGDCCTAHENPGCADEACCSAVCQIDPFCCNSVWDADCAVTAAALCGCPMDCPESDHDCYTIGAPGCTDGTCCGQVCSLLPACCETAWDSLCVSYALVLCELPDCPIVCEGTDEGEPCGLMFNNGCNTPSSATSSCCYAWGGVGCDNGACQAAVCDVDPFCCTAQWDMFCAQMSTMLCPELCPITPLFGSVACGETICGTVWVVDGQRDTDWFVLELAESTTVNVSIDGQMPMTIGIVNSTNCFTATGLDPFALAPLCGSASFDVELEAGEHWVFAAPTGFGNFPCGDYNAYRLTVSCGPSCVFGPDRNDDGCVNGADLAIVIGQWDPFGSLGHGFGPGDANCDGVVDGADLTIVLGGWQPICP